MEGLQDMLVMKERERLFVESFGGGWSNFRIPKDPGNRYILRKGIQQESPFWMGLEPSIKKSRNGSGFLGTYRIKHRICFYALACKWVHSLATAWPLGPCWWRWSSTCGAVCSQRCQEQLAVVGWWEVCWWKVLFQNNFLFIWVCWRFFLALYHGIQHARKMFYLFSKPVKMPIEVSNQIYDIGSFEDKIWEFWVTLQSFF